VEGLTERNIPYELFDFEEDRVILINRILSGDFTTVVVFGFGANGPGKLLDI
jgi:hypothetical protein